MKGRTQWRDIYMGGLLLFSRLVISDSLRPHGLQPSRLLRPWDSPGKRTGVGCRCLLRGKFWRGSSLYSTRYSSRSSFLFRSISPRWRRMRAARLVSVPWLSRKYCCCSVTQLCLTHCDFMDCRTPGFPVLHYLLEFAQIHVHRVNDAIQPSHPLSSPSPPALNLSQHQGLLQSHFFASGGQSMEVSASSLVLPMNI